VTVRNIYSTHPKNGEDMRVYIQGSLVNSRWQARIQTLCKPLRHNQFPRDFLELHIRLERLFTGPFKFERSLKRGEAINTP
jgi:hypothetical protein